MPFSKRKDCLAVPKQKIAFLSLLLIVLGAIPLSSTFAATVNLAWERSTGPNIAGYKMHYGTSSRDYSYNVNVGNHTSCSLSGLQEGKRYYFAATAYNTSNVESDYSSEVYYTVPTGSSSGTGGSTTALIIDNGEAGTSSSGSWTVSSGSNSYGTKSVFNQSSGATYTFNGSRSGAQDVYLWYTHRDNRYWDVPVKIYNGSSLLDIVYVDQSDEENAGKWYPLGTYSFSGQAKIVIESKTSSASTCADAVKFAPAGSSTDSGTSGSTSGSTGTTGSSSGSGTSGSTSGSTGTIGSSSGSGTTGSSSGTGGSTTALIIDNGEAGTSSSGSWTVSSGSNSYGTKSVFNQSAGATYTFNGSRSGEQDVYLWYTYRDSRYWDVPVKIYNGSTLLDIVYVDQSDEQNAGKWYPLGTYSFSGQAKIVIESKTSSASTCADAVKFAPAGSSTDSGTSGSTSGSTVTTGSSSGSGTTGSSSGTGGSTTALIIDNGKAGTSSSGSWTVSSGSNSYGTKSVFNQSSGATYTFNGSRSGAQDVYLWYTHRDNRYWDVPVKIYNGSSLLDIVYVDQSDEENAGKWYPLGTYSFSGQAKIVIESKTSSASTCADAVKFAPAGSSTDSGTSGSTSGSTVTTGSSSGSGTTGSSSGTGGSTTALIIDNGKAGTSSSGSWTVSSGSNSYGTKSVFNQSSGATYTFNGSRSGEQDVYLWYTHRDSRYWDVPVKIYNGSTLLDIVYVDQSDEQNAGKWYPLGTYFFSGQAKIVIESKTSSASTCADAVKFEP